MQGLAISAIKGVRQMQGGGKMLAERNPAAILYAELRNFTRLSEVLDPERVLRLASAFFSLAAAAVKEHGALPVPLALPAGHRKMRAGHTGASRAAARP